MKPSALQTRYTCFFVILSVNAQFKIIHSLIAISKMSQLFKPLCFIKIFFSGLPFILQEVLVSESDKLLLYCLHPFLFSPQQASKVLFTPFNNEKAILRFLFQMLFKNTHILLPSTECGEKSQDYK